MNNYFVSGRICHVFVKRPDLPVVYWGEMANCSGTVQNVLDLCGDVMCNFVVYEAADWNADLSPWQFSLNKKTDFAGHGPQTLEWLVNDCVPYCEKEFGFTGQRILCGYSLAGLFSLWAFYESQAFSGVVSCSGSLWFGDWLSYAGNHTAPQNSSVYLSLGDREENARDTIMAAVGDCTRRQYELVCGDSNVSRHTLEWNPGGHFNEPELRLAKGIKWITGDV